MKLNVLGEICISYWGVKMRVFLEWVLFVCEFSFVILLSINSTTDIRMAALAHKIHAMNTLAPTPGPGRASVASVAIFVS